MEVKFYYPSFATRMAVYRPPPVVVSLALCFNDLQDLAVSSNIIYEEFILLLFRVTNSMVQCIYGLTTLIRFESLPAITWP